MEEFAVMNHCPVIRNINEHRTCSNFNADIGTGFRIFDIPPGETIILSTLRDYHLLAFLSGQISFMCGIYGPKTYLEGDMVVCPRKFTVSGTAVSETRIVDMSFDKIWSRCDKLHFRHLISRSEDYRFDMTPVRMRDPFPDYYSLLYSGLKSGIGCAHFHLLKHQEIFLYFKMYYSMDELVSLFYPVIQGLSGFKNIIYDHPEIYSVDAMAEAASMSRSSFLRRFKEEFGVNAGEWLKKRLCQNVAYACSNPENTIKDIVDKFNFSSPASFSRFCRLYFDCTPTELMARARTSRPPETFQL